jgi:hypothetical protein
MNIFAFFAVVLLAVSLTLGVRLHQATKAKDAALADKATLSVVVDAQSEVINAMHDDARLRDRALAERDRTINSLNADALAAVEAIGAASYEQVQNCDLDAPLPDSLSGPLLLLYQAASRDRSAGDPGDRTAVAVPASSDARAAVASDAAQSRAVDGKDAGMGR